VPSEIAKLLRAARTQAGVSQLELALRLGVSQRHVGFVERDQARPSRPLLSHWLEQLGLDSSRRNAAMLLAGYAPITARRGHEPVDANVLALRAIELHSPNPALAFDADWHIVRVNPAAMWLCQMVMPGLPLGGPNIDMLSVLADPRGWLARSREPERIASALLAQLRAEQWMNPGLEQRVDLLEAELRGRYGTHFGNATRDPAQTSFDVTFDTAVGPISFTAMQVAFGLPHDATSRRLRAELWFPADEFTSDVVRRQLLTSPGSSR
jgi:transcriptional regulator with XRE-family HTH domain